MMSNSAAASYDSPSSPSMAEECLPSTSNAPVIPCYTIPDSDEDRAQALLNSLSHNIMSNEAGSTDDPIVMSDGDQDQEPRLKSLEPDTPSVKVLFMNTDIGRKYRHEIEKFFHTLMTTENLMRNPEPLPKIQPRPNLNLEEGAEINATTVVGTIEVFYCLCTPNC